MTARRPSLTARVVRGLRWVASLAAVEIEAGDSGAFADLSAQEQRDVARALDYVYDLCDWHDRRQAD